MTTLPQHTQKMREKFKVQLGKFRPVTSGATNDILDELDAIIRETLAWAEEQVVPDKAQDMPSRMMAETDAYNECRAQIINSFKEIQGL